MFLVCQVSQDLFFQMVVVHQNRLLEMCQEPHLQQYFLQLFVILRTLTLTQTFVKKTVRSFWLAACQTNKKTNSTTLD